MGKLPNKELAYIALEKLSEYCLNEEHPTERKRLLYSNPF